ncbi:ANTAR domain-containing protein [Psychromonas arctica]|uniref:ANTAR domain-containing protein n=1 Tax=Psychromonas arctica TaxID=168275 RepID=A0ABU9HA84_9GAMM
MKSGNQEIYVLSNKDRDISSLNKVANRLGFDITPFSHANLPKNNNAVIFDVATILEFKCKAIFEHNRPLIALVSHATPSEIQHAMELGAYAVVTRPIHQLGLLSALQVSSILSKKTDDKEKQYNNLRRKHLSRCSVIKAVISFMDEFNVNDQKAYEMIRTISMSKNIEVETLCENLVKSTSCNDVYNKGA